MAAVWAHGLLNAFTALFPVIAMTPGSSQTRYWIFVSLGFVVGLITMAIRSEKETSSRPAAAQT